MNQPLSKQKRLAKNKEYAVRLIQRVKPIAYPINVKLVNNPFLKAEDKFQFIVYHLNEYNKRIEKGQVNDPYEMASYHKLHSMISDLAQIQTRADQVEALTQVYDWYKEQHRLVGQRRDQGEIRYEMSNNYRKYVNLPPQQNQEQKEQLKEYQLPTQLIQRLIEPYFFQNRTAHKQLDIPLRRLNEYKRKVINIAPFIDTKESTAHNRVLYPVPPKYEPPKEQVQDLKEGEPGQQGKQGEPVLDAEGQPIIEGEENKEEQGQPEQDLGGFGEEPEEPEEEQPPEDTEDKLAPKNKIFTAAVTNLASEKLYKGQYMQYRGRQTDSERSLEQRYLKLQEDILVKQREDRQNIELATERGKKKSKMSKQIQKKLEDMIHRPNYLFSQEEAVPVQKLSKQDEVKYGFTTNMRVKPRHSEFDLTNKTTILPRISDDSFQEKSIRRDRMKSLKGKFSKMLNLTEYQERESAPSMCQYTARRRGFSEIVKHHSKSKQRLIQLDEVTRIKEKLTRNKIGVNIKALSQGLCIPDSEDNSTTIPDSMFANKELPSNPFMVETKKKKKKKK